jgi:transcriptional antiterminator RfaH
MISDNQCWYVIHTHPKQEERAERNLRSEGLQTFYPRIKERRFNKYTGEIGYVIKPLFPRYLFARFDPYVWLREVRYTRGVHCVVSLGESPTPVDGEIIAIIRSRLGDDGFVRIGEKFHPGDLVMVKDGPLKSFVGLFERDMRDSDRVMVLLTTVGYQAHVMIERDLLKKII